MILTRMDEVERCLEEGRYTQAINSQSEEARQFIKDIKRLTLLSEDEVDCLMWTGHSLTGLLTGKQPGKGGK
ncbi:hypothetical protein ACFLXT_04555 [Chloroflexota bacterium]